MSTEWKRICCAIDFTETSGAALEVAASLARRFEAELSLVHVNQAALQVTAGEVGLTTAEMLEDTNREASRRLDALRWKGESMAGRPVQAAVVEGRAVDEIVRLVRAGRFDLLVMGTRGRSGMSRFVHGSVAEEVERQVHCHVLLVKAPVAPHV